MRRNRFGCANGNYQTTYPAMPQVGATCQNTANGTQGVAGMGYYQNGGIAQNFMNGTTTYQELTPIMTCSKNVVNQYHVTKQPYVHTYHTEVVHHHIKQAEYIPNYTCSEVHVNENFGCGR